MKELVVYAVRHKTSGYFFTQRDKNRGSTWQEVSEKGLPRFFKTQGHAKSFLTFWIKGKHMTNLSKAYFDGSEEPYIAVVKDELRRIEDYEIVQFELTEKKNEF